MSQSQCWQCQAWSLGAYRSPSEPTASDLLLPPCVHRVHPSNCDTPCLRKTLCHNLQIFVMICVILCHSKAWIYRTPYEFHTCPLYFRKRWMVLLWNGPCRASSYNMSVSRFDQGVLWALQSTSLASLTDPTHIRYIHNTYIIHTDTYSIYQNIITHPADSSFRCFQDQTAAISCHGFSISIDPGQWMVHLKDLSMLHMCLWWGSLLGLTALVQGAAALSPNLFASGTGSRQSLLSCSAAQLIVCERIDLAIARVKYFQPIIQNHSQHIPSHSH